MPQLFCNFFCSRFSPKHRSICGVSFCTCRIQSSRTHKSQAPSLKSADSNHERRTQELENSLNCLHGAVIPQMDFSTQAVSFQIPLKWWCFKMSMKQIQRVNTQKVRNRTLVLTHSEKPLRLPCHKHSAQIILVRSKQDSVPVSHSKQIPQRKENKKRQRHPAQNEKLALLSADFCTQRLHLFQQIGQSENLCYEVNLESEAKAAALHTPATCHQFVCDRWRSQGFERP